MKHRDSYLKKSALLSIFCLSASAVFSQNVEVLTEPEWGTELSRAVIDTRLGPQFSDFHVENILGRPENPLVRIYNEHFGPPSKIVPGGLLNEPRATIGQYFPGIQMDGWAPPDPKIAVGPNHIVAVTNMKIAFFSKSGQKQYEVWLGNQAGSSGFFHSVGAKGFTFDPKVLYDRNTGRFFVVALEYYSSPQESMICIAVSDDSDPHGTWYLYRTDSKKTISGTNYWVDYPGFGVDKNALYVSGNLFGFSSGFGGVLFRGYPLSSILNGGSVTFFDFVSTSSASVQAAQTVGYDNNAQFFASVNNTSSIRIHAITGAGGGSPTLTSANVSVPSFSYPNSNATQQGSSSRIDVLDGRIMNVWFQKGRLLAGHAVRPNSSTSRTVGRWYDFNMNNWPISGSPTLKQSGNIDAGGSIYVFFPAIAFNDFMDIGAVVARSSSNEYAGVWTTGRKTTDPDGTMGNLVLAKAGTTAYTQGRWGDYFGIQVDPTDGLTFWGVGEYVESSSTWKTWVANWKVATYRKLTVQAKLRDGTVLNVPITCTVDGYGNGNGTTPFNRTYYDGFGVSLTAPGTHGSYKFNGWKVGIGAAVGNVNPTKSLTMNNDITAIAEYR